MKKELIEKITSRCLGKIAKEHIKQILSEELPDFQRIDEERMGKILNNIVGSSIYYDQLLQKSVTLEAVRIYNSTLSKAPAQPPALKPLPKEMPKDLTRFAMGHDVYEVWDKIISEYGTPANNLQPLPKATPYEFVGLFNETHSPRKIWEWLLKHYGTPEPKQPLPTVEELAKEMLNVWNVNTFNEVAEYVINKYSLHAREWWQGDIKGMKVKLSTGEVKELDGSLYARTGIGSFISINAITPYTPPSAQDIIAKHNLSEEEVKILREGK